ncbi:calcium-transporting ATPase 10, plasma membrane-type isoform X2 [Rosa chinensis]|uniref:calcium-transporting ATPase 10, plasma membrane-type isoform X2 n=1 Tax=Rosa chinensis TaxID=74649 RepID=UPI000D0875F5|nr:calcium-transporting ATPase 10, plasma membrane-type isoform X2 [Rosa chinensis]
MSHSSELPYNPSNDLEAGLKEVPVERVNRWGQVKLYLKPLYRFRHTLVLKREEEKKQAARKLRIRAHIQALRAVAIFKQVADQVKGSGDDFPIEPEELASMSRNSDVHALQRYRGKEGLADSLKTNLDKGIDGGDLQKRIDKFGSNKNPPEIATSHWTKKLGWHDVFSVAIAAAMFIFITVLSNYTQARLQNMIIREKMTYRSELKVIRAGRQVPVSICDIVVGDVIFLEFGDEVCRFLKS